MPCITISLLPLHCGDNRVFSCDVTAATWVKTLYMELSQRQRRRQRDRHKFPSFFSISLPSSAKQQREITKFEERQRLKINFPFAPFILVSFLEDLPHLCHVKMLGIVVKRYDTLPLPLPLPLLNLPNREKNFQFTGA